MTLLVSGDRMGRLLHKSIYELDLKPRRHCLITLPNNRYPLVPIQSIGMPKMNAKTIITSPFEGESHDILGGSRERSPPFNFSYLKLIGTMELFRRA